ncbi:MAG: EamA family transporter [Chloroflexota bacterium]
MTLAGPVLALLSALIWGAGDFLGGLATRTASSCARRVATQLTGLTLALLCRLLVVEPVPGPAGIAWGLAAGASGLVGVATLYRALARGTMGLVAPLTGLVAAALPALLGLAWGDPLTPLLGAGIVAALAAIVAISLPDRVPAGRTAPPLRRADLALVVVSGLGFSGFYLGIDRAHAEGLGAVSTLVALRCASAALVLGAIVVLRGVRRTAPFRGVPRAVLPIVLLGGLADTGGNLVYVLANAVGTLSTTVVLGSLYPASTAILAAIVLRERLTAARIVGVVLALVAAACIGLGALGA